MTKQNQKKTPEPRLTNAQLQEIVAQHIEGCNLRIDELKDLGLERKIPGITREITRLHKMVEDIKAEVGRMRPDEDNMFTNQRNRETLEEIINGRLVVLNSSITEEFASVNARINEVDVKVDILGDAHNNLAASHGRLTGRVNDIKVAIDASTRFPWGRAIIAVIVGIIAGVLWDIHDFSQTVKMNDGKPITIPDWHDDLWVAFAFGALVAVAIFGLMALFVRKNNSPDRPKSSDYATEDTKYVPPVPVNPNPITKSIIIDEDGTAPTKPLPVRGAPVGTP